MRDMRQTRRLLLVFAAAFALATPLAGRQEAAVLQGADPPQNAVWVDSLDLSNAPIRRPRAQRGQTAAAPLVFRLGGATYAHALPLLSDGDLAIDLGGAALKFVAVVGIDDGQPQAGGAPPGGAAPPRRPAASCSAPGSTGGKSSSPT
jgi:hypothetical protein